MRESPPQIRVPPRLPLMRTSIQPRTKAHRTSLIEPGLLVPVLVQGPARLREGVGRVLVKIRDLVPSPEILGQLGLSSFTRRFSRAK